MADQPNVLLITTDQQFAGAMSCAGNPHLNTPAMDRLAADGVRFDAAYSSNPICVAARTCNMTGLPSHVTGVSTNIHAGSVPLDVTCLPSVFRDAGYATAHFGKWQLPRPVTDQAWSGFDHIGITADNGRDRQVADEASAYLAKVNEPFFAIASFSNPHDACQLARKLSGMGDRLPDAELTLPPPEDCPPLRENRAIPAGEPPVIREHQQDPTNAKTYPVHDWPSDDPRWRQYLWGYYRMIENVDTHISRVLAALDHADLTERTIILFTSDHGDGMGSHGWNQKTLFYEESARVPFVVSWQGHARGGVRDATHLVNAGLDLFPTLFDLASIASPCLPGISAGGAAMGKRDAVDRPYIVCQTNHLHGYGTPGEVDGRMVRSAHHKYICYSEGSPREQLFDLQADPGELHDLRHHGGADDTLAAHRVMACEYARDSDDPFNYVSA